MNKKFYTSYNNKTIIIKSIKLKYIIIYYFILNIYPLDSLTLKYY